MKYIISSLLFGALITNDALACGGYETIGKVMMKDGVSGLVIYPDTKSQIDLRVEFNESTKLSPYIDTFIKAKISVEQLDLTFGYVTKISDITSTLPNQLATDKGTKLKQLTKAPCKSSPSKKN